MRNKDIIEEANQLTRYLLRKPIENTIIYELYMIVAPNNNPTTERKLLEFAFSHPWSIPFLDAALVFLRPESELRRRIYIMFSILESMPEYSDMFLPKRFRFVDIAGVVAAGIRAVFRVIIGIFIIKIGRL